MEKKVLGYITIYEDKAASLKCLEAIESQTVSVDRIFIVDNSQAQLLENSDDNSRLILHFPSNIGISQGLVLALEWGIQENYDFLWAFDQDSIPNHDCLAALLAEYSYLIQQENKVGIVAPVAFDRRSKLFIGGVDFKNDKFIHRNFNELNRVYECDAPITSGSLIDLKAAKLTDFPLVDLFIDGVDFDYGLKFRRQGFSNFVVTKAKLEHNYGTPLNIKIANFNWLFQSYSPLRYYYSSRNTTYLVLHYAQGVYKLTASVHRIKTMILKIAAIIIFEENHKLKKAYAYLLGTYHGFIQKLAYKWQENKLM
jgi:rhamnosyltransferase